MSSRRSRVREGLGALLRSTTPGEAAEEQPAPPQRKRHTSIYLTEEEWSLLQDLEYELTRRHHLRGLKRSDLFRAMLHLAHDQLRTPQQGQRLAAEVRRLASS